MAEREAILLVRLDGVGDAALCIPSLEGLQRAFPQAEFGAVCSRANAALFSDHVRHIHIYDAAQPIDVLREELASVGYTKALIATEEVAGYQIGRLSGAAQRAGFWHRWHKPFKSLWQRSQVTTAIYRPAAWRHSPEHEVMTIYRLAVALGARAPAPSDTSLRRWLRTEMSDEAAAARGAIGFQITPKLTTLGLGPSTLAAVINETLSALGARRGVLIAADTDEPLACAILEHMPATQSAAGSVQVAAGLSVPKWVGLLAALDTLVTPDTGAAHVAGMLGLRVIDIFEAGDFERLSAQWRPWAGSWRCHAKRAITMEWDAAAYGRFIALQIQSLRAPDESSLTAPLTSR